MHVYRVNRNRLRNHLSTQKIGLRKYTHSLICNLNLSLISRGKRGAGLWEKFCVDNCLFTDWMIWTLSKFNQITIIDSHQCLLSSLIQSITELTIHPVQSVSQHNSNIHTTQTREGNVIFFKQKRNQTRHLKDNPW